MDYKAFELTAQQLAAEEKFLKEYDMSLGHSETDYINNNNW